MGQRIAVTTAAVPSGADHPAGRIQHDGPDGDLAVTPRPVGERESELHGPALHRATSHGPV